ncbi:sugar ABC transporter substrate-binding protein [Lacrimispora sp.]|uniref:ABC transporter substrate-binding protein n=1 Tax=Lacrimispora sp. TaxID=2719234 RepID=UPI003461375E
MKRKLLSSVLLVSMAASVLAGCGNNEGGSKAAGAGAGAQGAEKITLWRPSSDPAVEVWWEETVAKFNEEYTGKYELTYEAIVRANSYAYEDKVNSAITSNDLPDILLIDGPNVANYAANNIIIPLDDYIADEDKNDLSDSSRSQNTYDGKLFAMSNSESSVALYYNKDMLDAAGITVPEKLEDAWTWTEFFENAKKLTTDTVVGTNIIIDKGEGIPYGLEPFWISNGTDFVSPEGDKADGYLNSPEGVEAASFLNSLIQNKIANIEPIPKEFHTGNAATMLSGSWEVRALEEYPDLNWGITYYPVADGGKPASPTGDWTMTITKDSKNTEAAAVALNYLTSKENAATYADAQGKPPARISSYDALPHYNEAPNSIFKEQLMNTGAARPRTPSYTVLSPQISEAMMNIFTGADVQESLDRAAKNFDEDYQMNYGN